MKHVEVSSHVRIGLFTGWLVRIGVLCVAAAFLLHPMSVNAGTKITQGEFLGWLASVTGEAADLGANPSITDLMEWAQAKGLNPNGGWKPGAVLTKDVLAQTIVQLFNLNPKKYGGDLEKNLLREGIVLPTDDELDRADLVQVLDQFGMISKISSVGNNPFTDVKGNNGKFGESLPPGFWNPRNPHYQVTPPGGHPGLGRGPSRE